MVAVLGIFLLLLAAGAVSSSSSSPPSWSSGSSKLLSSQQQQLKSLNPVPSSSPIREYTIPSSESGPLAIISGGNGTYWFTEFGDFPPGGVPTGGKIGEFSSSNATFKEFQIPESGARPAALAKDSFGNIWFADQSGSGSVWKLDPSTGRFTQFKTLTANSTPLFVLVDPKTNDVWFTELTGNKIGELTYPNYVMSEYSPPTANSGPAEMALEQNSTTLWITETYASQIATFNIETHSFNEFKPSVSLNSPIGIVLDASKNVWISEHGGSSIVEYTPSNSTWKKFPTSPPSILGYDRSAPATLAIDKKGVLWFVEHFSNKVGRFDPQTGQMNEFVIPTLGAYSVLNAVDPNGNFWFTQYSANRIGEISGNTSSLVSISADAGGPPTVEAGQTIETDFVVTNSYSQPVTLQLNSSSTFSSSGVTSSGGISLNSSTVDIGSGQSKVIQASITPGGSLPSGVYSIGISAAYGNSSSVGYVFLNVQNNSLLVLIQSNLLFIGIIVIVALIVAVLAVRMVSAAKRGGVRKRAMGEVATLILLGIFIIFATMIFAPALYPLIFRGVIWAQGKCPGIPQYQNQGPDWFTYTLDAATIAVIAFLGYLLVRDYRRGRFGRTKEGEDAGEGEEEDSPDSKDEG